MKLIKNKKTEKYHEIEVVKTFLLWRWTVKYRKVNGNVFRYIEPNKYISTGLIEYLDVKDLFYAEV